MPFIPHTEKDIQLMLGKIAIPNINALFDEIPKSLATADLSTMPEGMNEAIITRLMQERTPRVYSGTNFLGAGAYEHFIPAAVWQIAGRGEYYTAYTPYQAEASQGSLQLMYEYQSMMAELMAMEVSNASLYDGATALAEAILMAIRIKQGKAKKVMVPLNIHPHYAQVLKTILTQQEIILLDLPFDENTGTLKLETLSSISTEEIAAFVIPQPNFLGCLEEVDLLCAWAKKHHILTIALVNPMAMALLKPPGQWDETGVDIACGEGQPLGVPLAGGGPYFGFLCCRQVHIRQMPGRLVGKTLDRSGKTGYTLTLQAREQHIRRSKATSNICTNQGLLVVAATIYMTLLGAQGLYDVAKQSHCQAKKLYDALLSIKGIKPVFSSPFFHEFVISFKHHSVEKILARLRKRGVQAGFNLTPYFQGLKECLLICVTEMKTDQDLVYFAQLLKEELSHE